MRQGQEQLPGRHGVLPRLLRLGRIPQHLAVPEGWRRTGGRQDLRVLDAVLGGEVELHRQALIHQPVA